MNAASVIQGVRTALRRSLPGWRDRLLIALLAFVPVLASRQGVVTDDTKTYLYLDPGRYVRQAVSMWTPTVGGGTVTHQNVGYLLPMGPFYWILAELHVPLWVAQRLWLGSILFAAGTGMLFLWRTLGLGRHGRFVAAVAFMLTPYVMQYTGRISVILLPWAGLPWMLGFVIRAVRRGGWRDPALFALTVALVSGVNASSLLYVGLAPALWIPYAIWIRREATWRRAWTVVWRVGLLTSLVSLWWAVGLQIEAAYGIDVLKYTETLPATSSTSLPTEVLRGLGYWYFYGTDRLGAWTQAAVAYTTSMPLVVASFALPVLALLAAALVRWRDRVYFALLLVLGVVLSVGAYPFRHPTALGAALKAFMTDTTAGFAMRSTDRATPMVILALALFLGTGAAAAWRRWTSLGGTVSAVLTAAVVAASTPLLTGAFIANGFTQPAGLPAYMHQAAAYLNAQPGGFRVYALPGNDFAAARFGDTIDTAWPALLDRPFITHEQQIMGSLPTADLLHALDAPLQAGTADPRALAPIASLMSAGSIIVQYDQAYERYDTPNPIVLADEFARTPPGLTGPVTFGAPIFNMAAIPTLSEQVLADERSTDGTPPVAVYQVPDPRPIVRTESLGQPLVIDGDAAGLVNAAAAGLVNSDQAIFYAGTLTSPGGGLTRLGGAHPDLVLTDTNRKVAFEWNSMQQNEGYTETAQQPPDTTNPGDSPVDLFPHAPAGTRTTAAFSGVASVTASSYGSSITYLPEYQPAAAFDGNTDSAWLTDFFKPPAGQWWQVTTSGPITAGSIDLVQPLYGGIKNWITKVTLQFDHGPPVTATLGTASRTEAGQTIDFAPHTFSRLRIVVDATSVVDGLQSEPFPGSVGLAEVRIPGVTATESIVMPTDLLGALGSASLADPLTIVMQRLRSSNYPPDADTEPRILRTFSLPTGRSFTLAGTASLSAYIPDDMIDRLVGRVGSGADSVTAYSNGRLPGDVAAGAINTVDGDPSTVWEPGFGSGPLPDTWLHYQLGKSVTFDHLDLQVVADGQHSVPTQITVQAGSASRTVAIPPIADSLQPGATVDVPVDFPALSGSDVKITVDGVRAVSTVNYFSQSPSRLPVGIAEVGIPGVTAPALPASIPATCTRSDLAVDGNPVWIAVSGSSSAALQGDEMRVRLCGPDAKGIALGAGTHQLVATDGHTTGWNIDSLVLGSAPGGAPAGAAAGSDAATTGITATVIHSSATSMQVQLHGLSASSAPFMLVLGQSINAGWHATLADGTSLGAPVLVDGFANGFRVDPAALAGHLTGGVATVTLDWAPQHNEDVALVVSALAIAACAVVGILPWERIRRRVRRWRNAPAGDAGTDPAPASTALDGPPHLAVPLRHQAGDRRLPWWGALVAGAAAAGAAWAIGGRWAGLGAGVAVVAVTLLPPIETLVGLAAAVALAVANGQIIAVQLHTHQTVNGLWTARFAHVVPLAWVAVALVGADAVAVALLGRRVRDSRRRRSPAEGAVPPEQPGEPAPVPDGR